MDAFLGGPGYWVAWVTAFAAGPLSASADDRALWRGLAALVASVAWPLALRAAALRGDADQTREPTGWPARLRRGVVAARRPLAVAFAALAATGMHESFGRVWLTALQAVVAFAAVAYAVRPLPPRP